MPTMDTADIRAGEERLRQIWIHRLYLEYDHFLRQYRLRLKRPIIRIEPLGSRWGIWEPLTRTITLNTRLIEKHPWDAVLEILKHEMAHQLVSDVYGQDHTHGRHFAHACRVLRVADWATRAAGDIPDQLPGWKDRVLSEEEERLLRRVEKLLSLAGSTNEHEALLAMQRVQEIYARYNLDRLKRRQESSMVSLTIHFRKKRVDRLDSMICSVLGEHFFVRVIFGQLYDAKDLCDYRTVELIGTRENVLMAEYVYHFLWHELRTLWDDYRARNTVAGRSRQDYMLGVLSGFRKKLSDGKAEVLRQAAGEMKDSETNALVAAGDHALEAFVQHRYPRLNTRRWSASYRDQSSFAAGVEEGGRIVLRRAVTEAEGNRGKLLKG